MKLKNCILLLLLAVITLSACKDNDNDKDILSAVNKEKISEALANYPYDVIAVSKEYGAEDNAYDYYYYVDRSSVQLDNSFFVVKYDKKTIYYSYSTLKSISLTTSPSSTLSINFNNN